MNTILNSFRIQVTAFQPAGAAVMPGFGDILPIVKMLLASVFDRKKINGLKRRRPLPVEIPQNGQDETFDVTIKLVRKVVRPGKPSNRSSRAATERAKPFRNQAGDSAL